VLPHVSSQFEHAETNSPGGAALTSYARRVNDKVIHKTGSTYCNGPSHGDGQVAQKKMIKFGGVVFEIYKRTDKQTGTAV